MKNPYNYRKHWWLLLCLMILSITSSGFSWPDDTFLSSVFPANEICADIQNTDSSFCSGIIPDTLRKFMRFDRADSDGIHFYLRMSMFRSRAERLNFYNNSRYFGIFMEDKRELENDSARFVMKGSGEEEAIPAIAELFHKARVAGNGNADNTPVGDVRIPREGIDADETGTGFPREVSLVCEGAQVACSENIYAFPSGTSGDAPSPVNGYPNYGCLGSYPGPAWFYMQIGVPGDIIIGIDQGTHDVDFICWGPFTSLSDGCSSGLTGTCHGPGLPACCDNDQHPQCDGFYPRGNIVDCSYSPDPQEICHILDAQAGEFYILLITNFSGLEGTITFSQTGGDGRTNCDIVVFCSMVALTTATTSCSLSTNTYSLSGNMEFSNPPLTGTLRITDNTAMPPVYQDYFPPFTSPLAYSLTNIPCDGLIHSVTATFTDSLACTITQHYTAPQDVCPEGTISGGGGICDDGVSHVNVYISLSGPGPYDFVYAINGSPQTPVTGYTGPPTYIISATIPGIYTLVSLSNPGCTGTGTVSGSAEVTLKPVPVPAITGDTLVCSVSTDLVYTTESGNSNYDWVVSSGSTVTDGGGPDDNFVTITWNTPGVKTVSVNYRAQNGCSAALPTILTIQNKPFPVITNAGSYTICSGATPGISPQSNFPGTVYTWTASGSSAAVTGYSDGGGPTITDVLINTGMTTETVTYVVTPVNDGCAGNPANFVVFVNPRSPVLFTLCNDPVVPADADPFRLKGGIPSGGTYSGTGVNSATGIFSPASSGTGIKTITYTYSNAMNCISSATQTLTVVAATAFTCGQLFKDVRDNKSYPTLLLGSQCWMAANLEYGQQLAGSADQRDNCAPELYCYGDDPANCASQGGLYQWDEMMQYDETAGTKGACPWGWHVPDQNEWNILFAIYINNGFAGNPLKYSGYSGFNALLTGMGYFNKKWLYQGFGTFFWSSTGYGSIKAWSYGMNDPDPSVSVYPSLRTNAFSVRCVKDN